MAEGTTTGTEDHATSPKEDIPGQPNEPPVDEADALIRRFYTGGLPREEFEARMKAIGASLDDVLIEEQRIINPDPEQPGSGRSDASIRARTHKLDE